MKFGFEVYFKFIALSPVKRDEPNFRIHYRYWETMYRIAASQTLGSSGDKTGVAAVTIDGIVQRDLSIPLVDDRQEHLVEIAVIRPILEQPQKTLTEQRPTAVIQ